MTGYEQASIGNITTPFTGTFDGNGNTVYGINIVGEDIGTGLFGVVTNSTEGDKVVIKDLTVEGNVTSKARFVGGIVGIVCGETETGVTTQLMDEGMDTGDILEISRVDIAENETAAELYDRLAFVAADLLVSTVDKLGKGEIVPTPQNHDEATYAPIIKKEMALIDFNKDAKTINNAIRGYNSWPVAYFMLGERRLKVFSAEVGERTNEKAGTVIKADKEFIIAAGNGTSIKLNEVQLEGSKRMSAAALLQGNKIEVKSVL